MSLKSERTEGVKRMPPLTGPTVYEEGKEGLRVGKSYFSQGKEQVEVKNILGILNQNGRFLSEKKNTPTHYIDSIQVLLEF